MIYAGIDIGSATAKAALIRDNTILGTKVIASGYHHGRAAETVFSQLLTELQLPREQVKAVVGTGYGREGIGFCDKAMTEILCHGAGAHFLQPGIQGIVDIGGQDSKAIRVDSQGNVVDFSMNDKCAAGTGRFLEVMARALELDLSDLGSESAKAKEPCRISSICTVFAESEVISLIARQKKRSDIVAGIHASAAARAASLAIKIGLAPPLMMTGGVARNPGMKAALASELGCEIQVSPLAQEAGAIGAAVLASRL